MSITTTIMYIFIISFKRLVTEEEEDMVKKPMGEDQELIKIIITQRIPAITNTREIKTTTQNLTKWENNSIK